MAECTKCRQAYCRTCLSEPNLLWINMKSVRTGWEYRTCSRLCRRRSRGKEPEVEHKTPRKQIREEMMWLMQPKDGARLKAQKSKRNHMQALSAFDINILYLETCTGKKRKQSPTPEKDDHPSKQQKSKNIQDWRRNRGKGKAIVNTSVNDSAQENIPPAMSGQQPSTPAARKKAVVKPKTPRKKTAATSIRANAAAAASAVTEHAVGLSSTLTPETTSQDKAIVARGATITDHSPIKSRIDMVTEMEAQVDMEQAEASASSDSAPIITQRTSTVEEKAQARTRATGSR